jgi:hypothetical protein
MNSVESSSRHSCRVLIVGSETPIVTTAGRAMISQRGIPDAGPFRVTAGTGAPPGFRSSAATSASITAGV